MMRQLSVSTIHVVSIATEIHHVLAHVSLQMDSDVMFASWPTRWWLSGADWLSLGGAKVNFHIWLCCNCKYPPGIIIVIIIIVKSVLHIKSSVQMFIVDRMLTLEWSRCGTAAKYGLKRMMLITSQLAKMSRLSTGETWSSRAFTSL